MFGLERCWNCDNCKHVAATQRIVLAAANPPLSHAAQRDVDLWNNTLRDNPCTNQRPTIQELFPITTLEA